MSLPVGHGWLPREQWNPTAADRGMHGLDGPACPEREHLDQSSRGRPVQKLCVHCGRVTARRDEAGRPWCGGAAYIKEDE